MYCRYPTDRHSKIDYFGHFVNHLVACTLNECATQKHKNDGHGSKSGSSVEYTSAVLCRF